eukprot:CAMPEP_0178587444 /NCGR_PEP_ID=MMETSP0697-20121206/26451_1 /TAXON_ID=265572 /ORGANISM="Extubocellulus spinifer, Strain CCMP396" /LENGTH=1269 /DNA_ID=CAMNT_0020223623 /DNA_START=323 /DNA_END=4132 /DNA_ORIENTATION=+
MEWEVCPIVFEKPYADAEDCPEADEVPALVSWTAPAFIVGYCWICIVTALIIGFCAFNQRFAPIGNVVPLDEFTKARSRRKSSYPALEDMTKGKDDEASRAWTQTAYKKTIVGTTVYALVIATWWAFHAVLAVLVKFYYDQQNGKETNNPFEDETQVLSVFVVVLLIGFVWSLHLKWPSSIRSLFLRRCKFAEADYIAVWCPASAQVNENTKRARHIQRILCCMDAFNRCFNAYLSFLYSDVTRPKIKGSFKFCPVEQNPDGSKSFMFRLRRYNMNQAMSCFHPGVMTVGRTLRDFLDQSNGLSEDEVTKRIAHVGENKIYMKKPNIVLSICEEFSKLFYVYQMYIVWTWLNYWYYYMGLIYLATFVIGGLSVAYIKFKSDRKLYKLSQLTGSVEVLRDGEMTTKQQEELVPGDVVALSPGTVSCDLVVISGDNVLLQESALTGEANPVVKSSVDPAEGKALYDLKEHRRHTIFAGTEIVECKEDDRGIVVKAGSFSTRGELIRDILYYERYRFKFDVEIEIVLGILICWALIAFGITIRLLGGVAENSVYTFFYGVYVVASVIPPLLPTVFVVSVGISHDRLFRQRIACSESQAILVAGKVSVAFFDKTGTLTKQGMDFISAESFVDGSRSEDSWNESMTMAMSVCHMLVKSNQGAFIGNQVDACMFEASKAELECSDDKAIKITPQNAAKPLVVVKRFEFDHHRMTQSVVVMDTDSGRVFAFVKGSAESIKKLCKEESLPSDFDDLTKNSAKSGIYQISVAMKEVLNANLKDSATIVRDDVESSLVFQGFIDFKNSMREETPHVLKELAAGDVHSIMVTGDSIYTGVCIARESGLIAPENQVLIGQLDERGQIVWTDGDDVADAPSLKELQNPDSNTDLALSGEAWTALAARSKTEAVKFADHIKVFGRCSPNDKVAIVANFVKQGRITLMCGDGGNDCGALKTAHVGIALSDSEASIVSPFTSLDKTISSVLDVLKEGRCALASALKVYKYELMYGQITTFNQMANAWFGITFAEWNWVFMDGIWMISMAFTLPRARANKKLSPVRPTASLLGPHTMSSYLGILLINFLAMVVGLVALNQQSWYQCRKWVMDDISLILVLGDNYESTVIWLITGYQYISSAGAYNFGFTHRAPWWSNYRFVFFFVAFTVLHYYVTLSENRVSCLFRINCGNENVVRPVIGSEPYPINNNWNTTVMPYPFRWVMIGIMTANAIFNFVWEYYFVNGLGKKIGEKMRAKKAANKSGRIYTSEETSFENDETKGKGDDAV